MLIRLTLALIVLASPALAQETAPTRTPSHCHALADATEGMEFIHRASLRDVPEETVDLHYVGHASFLIRSAGGLNMVTDFTGFVGSTRLIPDVVTMNHAHDTYGPPFPILRFPMSCAAGGRNLAKGSSIALIWVKCWCAMSRPISDPSFREWRRRAIRSLSSRWRACASGIWAICTTPPMKSNMPPLAGWM